MTPAPASACAAYEWVQLMLDGRARAAWPHTDPNLRCYLIQAWMVDRPELMVKPLKDRERIVDRLAKANPRHRLWDDFADALVDVYRSEWSRDDLVDVENRARSVEIGPGIERVWLPDKPGRDVGVMLVRNVGARWLVAGIDDPEILPTPSWDVAT